jgi:hypothetical protein
MMKVRQELLGLVTAALVLPFKVQFKASKQSNIKYKFSSKKYQVQICHYLHIRTLDILMFLSYDCFTVFHKATEKLCCSANLSISLEQFQRFSGIEK